jgi:hypothetical protein
VESEKCVVLNEKVVGLGGKKRMYQDMPTNWSYVYDMMTE